MISQTPFGSFMVEFAALRGSEPNDAITRVCQQNNNIVKTSMFFRGMLDAMDAWATDGTSPPDSRIPKRSDGTLLTAEEWHKQFPSLPGVNRRAGQMVCRLMISGPMRI